MLHRKTNHLSASLVLLILQLVTCLGAHAQASLLFTSDHHISSSLIKDICYDSNGFIWIATENGLNRYDGSKFTTYKNIPGDSTSLAYNFVNCLFEDSNGNLIVSTYNGLQLYKPEIDAFSPVTSQDGNSSQFSMSDIIQLDTGELLGVGNRVGKIVVTPERRVVVEPYFTDITIPRSSSLVQDNDGNIWIASQSAGVMKISKDNTVEKYLLKSSDPVISCFAMGHDNVLYAGTYNHGLLRFDKIQNRFESLSFDKESSNIIIQNIISDERGRILLATDGNGLKEFNPRTGIIRQIPLPLPDHQKLKVHCVLKDEFGNLWAGLFQKGLLMIPNLDNTFHTINQRVFDHNLIGNSCVTAIWRDKDKSLWIGTDNDGIYHINPQFTNSTHYYESVPRIVMSFYCDKTGKLWVGSYEGGVGYLDKLTGRFNEIRLVDENGNDARRIYDFAEDAKGNMWISTMGNGIFIYNPKTNQATKAIDLTNKINNWITKIEYSPIDNSMYLGTYDGVYKINPSKWEAKRLLPNKIVNDLLIDPTNSGLWIATSDGLFHCNRKGEIDKTYDESNILPNNAVYSIEYDGRCLWAGSNKGLLRINPNTDQMICFTVDDGLQSNEFYKRASYHDSEGIMYFGGINGLSYFYPQDILNSSRKYDLRLTDFYVGETSVKPGVKIHGQVVVNQPVNTAKKFSLGASDNSFSVEFNTKQFYHPSSMQYLYSFDSKDWETLPLKNVGMTNNPAGNTLNFSNVKSGQHKLRIKAVDNDIETEPLEILIDVAPVWYSSWWAKLIYILLFIGVCYLIYWQLSKLEKKKQAEQERLQEEEIKESKLRFFTNVAHEVRTPLTLVISPLQQLMTSDDDPHRQKTYNTMMRNANRIMRLADEIMDIRKIDNKQMKLKFAKVELIGFISDIYEAFVTTATKKGIKMEFVHDGYDTIEAWIDKVQFDKILMNLLSNAVKYTPSGGNICLKISTGYNEYDKGPLKKYVEISVSDTGIGIPKEERPYVFDRFYRVANNTTGGTGIGLHLTHSFVNLHHGSIEIVDNPDNIGSNFVVRIPLENGHLHISEVEMTTNHLSDTPIKANRAEVIAANAKAVESANSEDVPNIKPKQHKTVYIAEDDEEVRQYLIDNLSKEFHVVPFANGAMLWEALCQKQPDLIVTDIMMPVMDGITLTEKIKQNIQFNHLPVIMLTAKGDDQETLKGLEKGADAYMTKPFNLNILTKTIQNLLASRQTLRNVYSGNQNQEERIDNIDAVSNDDRLLERVMKVVNKHLSDSDITVEQIAEEVGISRVHLHRKLKELTNQTTRDFLRNIRLQQAAKIMRENKLSVAEVCYMVGFKHPNNFSSCFKEMYGMSPSAYSEKYNP